MGIPLCDICCFSLASEIGKRKTDLGNLLLKEDGVLVERERMMAERLLKMIGNQTRYKPLFNNCLEIRFEDLTQSLDSQLSLISNFFGIEKNSYQAHQQLKKPSYSSTFRYGLKELHDKVSNDLIKFAMNLWGYQ